MPLPNALRGDNWTCRTARIIFPWLIYVARRGEEITYGELDDEIVAHELGEHAHWLVYSGPLGRVGDALEQMALALELDDLPPTNALVVNAQTRVPGDGVDSYVEHFYGGRFDWRTLSENQKLEVTGELHHQIHQYKDWNRVEDYLSDALAEYPELTPFQGPFLQVEWDTQKEQGDPNLYPYFVPPEPVGRGGEGDAHYQLKMRIANYPELIGLSKDAVAETEHPFGSGDKVDIEFRDGNKCVEVEIKGKDAGDMEVLRGVWQCIKYLHLAKTQQKLDRLRGCDTIREVSALLVVGRKMPGKARTHANVLGVRFMEVIN